ncbi:MAG TPA: hypothetical protein VM009_02585 [Terriglobales bacterium]|nr:hypothetical protein [Terriglobales bacterium]
MSLTLFQYVTWFTAPILLAITAIVMAKRKLNDRFPMFFTYAIFQVVSNFLLYLASHTSYRNYFYSYWVSTALGIALGFLVIHEIFEYAIRPYAGLRDLARMMFHWSAMVLLLVSGIIGFTAPGSGTDHLMLTIANLERGVRLMQCGMLLFIAVFSARLGLTWRDLPCGIALGFGIFAATDLTMYSLRAQLGPSWNVALSRITSIGYAISAVTWVSFALLPQAARVRKEVPFQPLFDRWNQAALTTGVAQTAMPAEQPAYLTDLQATVENILQQTNGHGKDEK